MNMTLIGEQKRNASIYFGCNDRIHHMHNVYETSIVHGKCTYVEDHMVTFLHRKMISQIFRTVFSTNYVLKMPSDPSCSRNELNKGKLHSFTGKKV